MLFIVVFLVFGIEEVFRKFLLSEKVFIREGGRGINGEDRVFNFVYVGFVGGYRVESWKFN